MKSRDTHKSKAILITGGSGFVGKALVESLSAIGSTVVSMYRHKLPEPMKNVYPVCTDLSSSDLLKAPLREVDSVVYLAWERSDITEIDGMDDRLSINLQSLANMLKAMEAVGTRKIIFVSALGASARSSSNYLRQKYAAESMVINSNISEKVIVRPTIIYDDENDKFVSVIANIVKCPAAYPVPSQEERVSPIHLDDVVATLIRLVGQEVRAGAVGIVELASTENYSLEEIFRLVAERIGCSTKIQLRGFMGHSLLALYQKMQKSRVDELDIKSLLTVGNRPGSQYRLHNPLCEALPNKFKPFSSIVQQNKAPS